MLQEGDRNNARILKDIYAIEEDLKKHTEIEDKLLLPAISRLVNMSAKKTGINSISGLTVYAIINKLVVLNDLNNQ